MGFDAESDEELMAAVARGNEGALETLMDRHAVRLHAYLARMTGSPVEAEDLLQETWVRVVRAAPRFDPARRLRPWLYGIATNLARDFARRRTVRFRTTQAERTSVEASRDRRAASPPAPLERLEQAELRRRVAALPEPLRAVLVLRYLRELDEAETAEALGVPRGTVKSRLSTAIRRLRSDYGEHP